MTTKEYLDLITSAFRQKPKFSATVALDVSVQVRVQELLASMIPKFDVDIAVGDQLDIIGKWVGVSRSIAVPIPSTGIYFTWDGTDPTVGWDFGLWQDANQPADITSLPDDAYRTLIRAKIAANKWDGTTDGAYAIWDEIFPNFTILIQDNQNMTYALAIAGGIVDSLTLALLTGGYIPLKPEGVQVAYYYVSVDDAPVFGWDVESTALAGWDEGAWVREIAPT